MQERLEEYRLNRAWPYSRLVKEIFRYTGVKIDVATVGRCLRDGGGSRITNHAFKVFLEQAPPHRIPILEEDDTNAHSAREARTA